MKDARGFRVRDGLLMIAVTAVGLSWARESWDAIRVHEGTFSDWSYQHSNPALPPVFGRRGWSRRASTIRPAGSSPR